MFVKTILKVFVIWVAVGVVGTFTVTDVGAGGPPQPYYADYVSGHVTFSDGRSPADLELVACLEGCNVYQSEPAIINESGNYKLELYPPDKAFTGRWATFYIKNEYGRIRAMETVAFGGGFKSHVMDLYFEGVLPTSLESPSLPLVGDPLVPVLAKGVILFGLGSLSIGALLLWVRSVPQRGSWDLRRRFSWRV